MSNHTTIEAPLIPLSLHHVGVQVELGDGKKTICVIDTGAAVTVIDRRLATPLAEGFSGLTAISGAGGATLGSLASVSLSLNGAPPIEEIAALSDLEMLHRFFNEEVGGILGGGVLGRYVVDIDLGARVLRLHSQPIPEPDNAISLPLVKAQNSPIPTVRAEIPDYGEVLLGLDSGAGVGLALIAPEPSLVRVLPRKRVNAPARGFAGHFEAQLGRGLSLGLGPFLLEDVLFLLSKRRKDNPLRAIGLAGVLGPQALFGPQSRFIIDRKSQKVHILRDSAPAPRDRAGFIFAISEGKRLVDGVVASSPAAEAGIREGDEFLGIIGSDANSRPALSRALAQPAGTRLELLIRRGEEQNPRSVPLVLRDYP